MRFHFFWIFLLLLCLPLRAEDLLPKVQRELRARKFYFGEIDGRASEETVEAVRRFQTSKGIDHTGNLDDETLHALGFPAGESGKREETQRLEECGTCVSRYLEVWQSGDWEREAPFFADQVDYYFDEHVSRDFIRTARTRENQRWPRRKSTMLNRIASLLPGRSDAAQVTVRVRTEVAGNSGPAQARTEDLLFRLEKTHDGWRITALKLLE